MANTQLSRTIGTATNGKKYTLSFWIKRSGLGVEQSIVGVDSANLIELIKFGSNDKLYWYNRDNAGNSAENYTSNVFRDTSAWYHLVFSYDSTEGSAANQKKLYINGVNQTWGSTAAIQANAVAGTNFATKTFYFGREGGGTSYFLNGLMSHIHYIDGTVYTASSFGSTDTTTGEWEINTSPSVTYGNNGFFILKNGNSVTDESTNSNNFTVAGGTLTKTEDNPSNVFATLNTLYFASADTTFANGNNTVNYNTDSSRSAFGTLGMTSGKYYFEVKIVSDSNNKGAYGICDTLYNNLNAVGAFIDSSSGYGYFANGQSYNGGTGASFGAAITTGDIVGVALDMDNLKLYFSKNGTWQNSGDPTSGASGTGAAYTVTADRTYLPAIRVRNGTKGAFNFGNGSFEATAVSSAGTGASTPGTFEYDVPTGYQPLTTKGLNV